MVASVLEDCGNEMEEDSIRTLSLLGFLSEHCQCPFECLVVVELNAQSREQPPPPQSPL